MIPASPYVPIAAAQPRFSGKPRPYIFKRASEEEVQKAKEYRQIRTNAKKGLVKSVAALLGSVAFASAGLGLTIAGGQVTDQKHQIEYIQVEVNDEITENHFEAADKQPLSDVGAEHFSPGFDGTLQLSDKALQDIDNAYSQMVLSMRENADETVSRADLQSRLDVLDAREPAVLGIVKAHMDDTGQISDVESLFNELTELFKDDMTPAQYQDMVALSESQFQMSDFESFLSSDGGMFLSFFSIFAGVGAGMLGIPLSIGAIKDHKRQLERHPAK